ncbi:MAG: hypothetical protein Q8O38_10725 [Sulfurimicrobium sp.]|nr:hypothetical protein [Sulfurimicrobium sp.]
MAKKTKDESAATRKKAIERFFNLREKHDVMRAKSGIANSDREEAHRLLDVCKVNLHNLDVRKYNPFGKGEEFDEYEEQFSKDRDQILQKIEFYESRKADANRRYWEFVNHWQSFGNLMGDTRNAVIALGFMSLEEAK